MGGGGEGVEMTPTEYEPPLELPDGCHHISLEKFLEVVYIDLRCYSMRLPEKHVLCIYLVL